jgi:PAS domain S-box-containing protein
MSAQAPALLAAIVESSDDAIISTTLDGTITSWNRAAERIFGYTAHEMMGRSTNLLRSADASEDPAAVLDKIRLGERVDHCKTLRRHKDGSDIAVSLSVSPVRDDAGKIIGASKVARDITSTRRAEEALRNTDRLALAGRMAASIAHEINNPLEAITNLLFLLQQESISDQARQYLDLAQLELMRVSHIASQTLGFFRGSPGPAACQLSDIVNSAIDLHAGRLLVSNVDVKTEYLPVAPLLCQQGELRQVMVNLVSNALDSMAGQGKLILRIRPFTDPRSSAPGIRFTVADTGMGMDSQTRRQLFEPFYTTKGSTGTGLGLWVTQQIIARHGGSISVRSSKSPLQHGSVFAIVLPYPEEPSLMRESGSDQKRIAFPAPSPPRQRGQTTSRADESRRTPSAPVPLSAAYNAAS